MCEVKRYIDINGERRVAVFHSYPEFLSPYGMARRWTLEDGSMILVPDVAWSYVKECPDLDRGADSLKPDKDVI